VTAKTVFAIIVLSLSVFAAQPNRWHGLLLDQSSPDQAIQTLGKPTLNDLGAFQVVIKRYAKKYHSPGVYTAFRIASSQTAKGLPVHFMLFEGAEGFKNVVLIFREEKLAMICLAPDKTNTIKAADIQEEYGIPFRPIFDQRDFDAMWTMWDQSNQEVRPRQYPPYYNLVGSSPDGLSGIVVGVRNEPSFGKTLLQGLSESTAHVPLADEKNPGKVVSLELLSPHALAIPIKHNSTLQ